MRGILLFAMLLCSPICQAYVQDPVVLRGTLPEFGYPDLEKKLAKIWQYTLQSSGATAHIKMGAPVIHFFPFNYDEEPADWILWKKQWLLTNQDVWTDWQKAHPTLQRTDDTNPFPPTFNGFHFDGTNHIQISPDTAFRPFYTIGPKGERSDQVGYGYYVTGHEMHHYALDQMGIPTPLHHCIFLQARTHGRPALMDALAEFVVEKKISNSLIKYRALKIEYDLKPCQKLTPQEQADVQRIVSSL